MTPLFLGIDLGTSSLKCGLFDLAGTCHGRARVGYPTREWDGNAEQNALDWWHALVEAVRLAHVEVDRTHVIAIAVGGHAPSPVLVNAHLQPVAPVLPWFDHRAASHRHSILATLGRDPANGPERLLVQVAARAAWLRQTSPSEFARAELLLHSGDYLVARLTGKSISTSPSIIEILAAAKLPTSLLPERQCEVGEHIGGLTAEAASELALQPGIAVVGGGLDSFLASVGSGMHEPGDVCLNTGSASVVALLADSPCRGRFEWAGHQVFSRPIHPAGRALEQARQITHTNHSLAQLITQAAGATPASSTDRLLVSLRQGKHGESALIASLFEVETPPTPTNRFRLLLEVILLNQRVTLDELQQQHGVARRIRGVGGAAAASEFNQLQADVLGRPVEVPEITDAGTLGAAMLATVALAYYTPPEAAARMPRVANIYHPRPAIADHYRSVFARLHAGAVDTHA